MATTATQSTTTIAPPEDMDTPRTVLKIDQNTPGTEVATETAAALASASLVFRRCDPSYSKLLLRRATSVFAFADKHRGPYSNGLKKFVCPYYYDYSGYQDELLWGAAWLHKATKNPMYLSYIQLSGIIGSFPFVVPCSKKMQETNSLLNATASASQLSLQEHHTPPHYSASATTTTSSNGGASGAAAASGFWCSSAI